MDLHARFLLVNDLCRVSKQATRRFEWNAHWYSTWYSASMLVRLKFKSNSFTVTHLWQRTLLLYYGTSMLGLLLQLLPCITHLAGLIYIH